MTPEHNQSAKKTYSVPILTTYGDLNTLTRSLNNSPGEFDHASTMSGPGEYNKSITPAMAIP